jgi:hypothetical protein
LDPKIPRRSTRTPHNPVRTHMEGDDATHILSRFVDDDDVSTKVYPKFRYDSAPQIASC